ncbi:hypothetical protein [Mycobacterium sp. HUMS_1102779]|uniref:hypothetical protein n=1 Tax=Mycobacterium sp. HUMS_1102779 TaxID=3383487 RepID=UPI00389A1456
MDPIDYARTTRRHAGETVNHGANVPGLIIGAVAVVALTVGIYALAAGSAVVGLVALVLAALSGAVSALWLMRTHRAVRTAEVRRHAAGSDEPPPPPTS